MTGDPPPADEALQRAIADACLGARSGEAMARDLAGFLRDHGVAPDDVTAALDALPRLAVYRGLVRAGIGDVVVRRLPRTRARMNAACAGRFEADLAAFADEVGPRTPYLRDVPAEFFAWAEPRWRRDASLPPYLADLAAHEITEFAVATSVAPPRAHVAAEVQLDRAITFGAPVRLARYRWAVHELPESADDRAVPAVRDVHLLFHRDDEDTVQWIELAPLEALVVERLIAGRTLADAVRGACAERAVAPDAVVADVARLLADLGERGVVAGAIASP